MEKVNALTTFESGAAVGQNPALSDTGHIRILQVGAIASGQRVPPSIRHLAG